MNKRLKLPTDLSFIVNQQQEAQQEPQGGFVPYNSNKNAQKNRSQPNHVRIFLS